MVEPAVGSDFVAVAMVSCDRSIFVNVVLSAVDV